MNMKIRPMTTADLDQVLVIEEQNFPDPFPRNLFEIPMKHPSYKYVVACDNYDDNKVLGYAILIVQHDEAHLQKMSVITDRQMQSIGSELTEYLISLSDEGEGFSKMWLEVRESNTPAIKLYEKFDFNVHCKRENYYKHDDSEGNEIFEDAIMMFKDI